MVHTMQTPHRQAWQVVSQKPGQVLSLLLFQLLLRGIAFIPLIYAAVTGRFFGFDKNYTLAFGFLFSLPLVVLIVLPFRFQAAARKAQWLGFSRDAAINFRNYGIWLRAALLRLLRALPYILPFFVFAGLYYYYLAYPDFIVPSKGLSAIGDLVGYGFVGGIIITGVVGVLTAVLAGCGWLRGVAFEHQAVIEQGISLSLSNARALRRRRKKTIRRTVFKNALLCLPALLGILVVLGQHLLSLPKFGSLMFDFFNYATKLILFDFPARVHITLGAILLVLWLPLLPLRKTALAAVMTEQTKTAA